MLLTFFAPSSDSTDRFQVCLVEDRVFLVSCKEVGFEIYKIRKFSCDDFELSFHLFNETSLAAARSLSSCKPVFPWAEVKGNRPLLIW